MHTGVLMFATDYAIRIDELAREAESRGFESLFVPEHTHIPTSRRSPFAGGAELPKEYWHTVDPFVGLMAAAAVTKKLKVGTGICLIIERDTIVTAKAAATLDFLSGGRFLFGIGAGWNFEEMRNHGTDPEHRWGVVRERIRAMQRIWTQDEAEFHGKHVDFDPIWSWPKPAQKPYPPILIGGNSPGTFKRVLDYGDEWLPIMGRGAPLEEQIAALQRQANERGRGTIPVSVFGVRADAETIERLGAAGVTRCLFGLPPAGEDKILPLLDRFAGVMLSYA